MCGIWAYFGILNDLKVSPEKLVELLVPRGPEYKHVEQISENVVLGFTRLAINGLTPAGHQPIVSENKEWVVVCNGEIYNYLALADKYKVSREKLGSDCWIIPYLLERMSVRDVCRALDGVFAFVAYHVPSKRLVVGRDSFGVRPLFLGTTMYGYAFSSEIKALAPICTPQVFLPSYYGIFEIGKEPIIMPWTSLTWHKAQLRNDYYGCALDPRMYLEEAVKKRLLSDRPIGALLSGGLDSSLIAAIAAKQLLIKGKRLHTFSIGMEGSPDLAAAQKVADHINSIHHTIKLTPQQFLDAVVPTIRATETYDITSVRASVGNWLIGKYIRENTDIKVVFNGDGSDELFGGYLYFYRAPDDLSFENEIERLLTDIHYFDVLRSERSMAAHGLESRTPFLDRAFVETMRRVPTQFLRPSTDQPEKWLIRKAFDGTGLLPDEILWRRKEAFSDGVSSTENSWFQILQRHAEQVAPPITAFNGYTHNPPTTAEARWYRAVFEGFFGRNADIVIPYMWMPRWSPGTKDPSARTLSFYPDAQGQKST